MSYSSSSFFDSRAMGFLSGLILCSLLSFKIQADPFHGLELEYSLSGDQRTSSAAPQSVAPVNRQLLRSRNSAEIRREIFALKADDSETSSAVEAVELACDLDQFATLTGGNLVDYLRGVSVNCTNSLFSVEGEIAAQIFDEGNRITIANSFAENATTYSGMDANGILNEILYLRAYYFLQFFEPAVSGFDSSLTSAVTTALQNFTNNSHFSDVNEEHGEVLSEAIILIDSAEVVVGFLSVYISLLDGFDLTYTDYFSMTSAVNSVYFGLFRVRQYDSAAYESAIKQDQQIINSLNDFIQRNTELSSSDNAYIWNNAGGEIARFLQDGDEVANLASGYVENLLATYTYTGSGAGLYIYTATVALEVDPDNCSLYDICQLREEVDAEILSQRIECDGTLVIRSQDLSSTQQQQACELLTAQAAQFHLQLSTGEIPISGDLNNFLEINVFDSSLDYGIYAGLIFAIDTNNGGIFLEGDPLIPTNQARFIAYEEDSDDIRVNVGIRNLKHEYVHYLDGRFNTQGDFSDILNANIVWWVEGLAEYIALGDDNVDAFVTGETKSLKLSEIFNTNYSDSQTTIYEWSYLAVRYFFEQREADLNNILGHFRSGTYGSDGDEGSYSRIISLIASSFDEDFHDWIDSSIASDLADNVRLKNFNLFQGESSGGSIDASITLTNAGIEFTWPPLEVNNYALYLKTQGSEDSFLFQVFPDGIANIDYDGFDLQGNEMLEGYFVLYAEDGNFISQASTFFIDLTELNIFLQGARLQQFACAEQTLPLILSIDGGERLLLELSLLENPTIQFQIERVFNSLSLSEEQNVATFSSASGEFIIPNLSLSCEPGNYHVRMRFTDSDEPVLEIIADGISAAGN